MAQKFFSLEEAADILGVTPDQLKAMRDRHDISGYRDGNSWKFKSQDVERLASERAADAEEVSAMTRVSDLHDDPSQSGDRAGVSDVVLLSDVELGESAASMSSTVIGKPGPMQPASESDIQLTKPKSAPKTPGDSDLMLASDSGSVKPDSDVKLTSAAGDSSADDLDMLDLTLDDDKDDDDIPLDLDSGSKVGGSSLGLGSSTTSLEDGGSGIALGSDILRLAPDDELNLEGGTANLSKPAAANKSAGGKGSDVGLSATEYEDDDLVLGSVGSDVGLGPGDSGISLADPSDSGLSLEEPLQLGGSDPALEPQADDFLLTTADATDDDLDASGSQVIALDAEAGFDDAAPTMLGTEPALAPMGDDGGGLLGGSVSVGAGMGAALAPSPMAGAPMAYREAPYGIGSVIALVVCFLVLALTGMMLYDLMRQMWSWDGPYAMNESIMDPLVGLFEK